MSDESHIRRGRHCVLNSRVQLVFVEKYRRRVFDALAIDVLRGIFADVCSDVHPALKDGACRASWSPPCTQTFPPLIRNTMIQQHNPAGLNHVILGGTQVAATLARPSPLAMPSVAWKLSDQEIADVRVIP